MAESSDVHVDCRSRRVLVNHEQPVGSHIAGGLQRQLKVQSFGALQVANHFEEVPCLWVDQEHEEEQFAVDPTH